ncbi:MAG: transposase [Chloroflexota bacterium]
MLYVGIDWGDGGSAVAAMDEEGRELKKWKVKQAKEDYERLVAEVSRLEASPGNVSFAIETPHHPLIHFVVERGYAAYTPNPKSVDRAREIERPSGGKDDFFDAVTLANMVRTDRGRLRRFVADSPSLVKLRLMCDEHRSLVERRTALINRVTHCLKAYWPDALELFSGVDTGVAMAFFERWSDPVAAGRAQGRTVRGFFKSRGYTCPGRVEEILAALRREPLPVPAEAREARSVQLKSLLAQLAVVREQCDAYEKQIAEQFDAHPDAHIFRSLLVGKDSKSRVLVARLLCDFGDRRDRYASREEVLALAGVAPVTYETGGGNYRVVRMRRACRKDFHNDVRHLSDLYRQHYPWAAAIYRAHRGEDKGHNKALRALGSVLVRIIYGMWKSGKEFDPDIYLARRGEQQLRHADRRSRANKKGRRHSPVRQTASQLGPQLRDKIVQPI